MAISSLISHIILLFHFFVTQRLIRGLAWLGRKITAVATPNTSPSSSSPSSSSSSPCPSQKHDVFLSFRGEDTRAKFTSHLEKRLRETKIETYIDNRLEKGDNISDALIEAIRSSKMSVIVFSPNYATSSWCLDEVLCVVECMKERGQIAIPVFYEIDPSHVRKQSGSYEAAFSKLKRRFDSNKLNQWRASLTQIANLAGFYSQQYRTEAELVEAIVKDIMKKLNGMSTSGDLKGLIGIDKSVQEMENLLCMDSSTVRIIGIWGMGGLGKTTLARVVFERVSSHFESSCFLKNVREESQKQGLDNLRKKLFAVLLDDKDLDDITTFHENRLGRKKVLIVLDDVSQPEQLNDLAGDHSWFGDGSRIIITTRDDQVLRDRAADKYQLKGLNLDFSLELFKFNAFKRNSPTAEDIEFSKQVVDYAQGIPLALKVLGSFFRSRRRENWEIELEKLKKAPNETVQNSLKISYDGLDEAEQRAFVDIVSFVDVGEGTCRHYVERILGGDPSLKRDIDNLIDKSLISDDRNYLRMHDLVREMGSEVVRQECTKEPGERSRLSGAEDCNHVFKHNTGTKTIEGISCGYHLEKHGSRRRVWTKQDCDRIFKHNPSRLKGRAPISFERMWVAGSLMEHVELGPATFKAMHRLRFLQIDDWNVKPSQQLDYLPDALKYLEWYCWPLQSMPINFSSQQLVEIRMRFSNLERLWSGNQKLGNLKHVDLSYSISLVDVSALSLAPNLESVDLSECRQLHHVPSLRFGGSEKRYHKCDDDKCSTLGHLNLKGCNVQVIFSLSGSLKKLDLSEMSMEELHSASIEYLSCLEELRLSHSERLMKFPINVCALTSLKRLSLNYCSISKIPNEISMLSLLEELDLSGNPIDQIPFGVKELCKLRKLKIIECKNLKFLPDLSHSLEFVDASGSALHTVRTSMEVLRQEDPWTVYHVTKHRRFVFLGCPLDQYTCLNIVNGFIIRVLRTAAAIVLNNVRINEKLDGPDIGVYLSRDKLPKWFLLQTPDPGMCINLGPQWHDSNFLGFAMAVAVAIENGHDTVDAYVDLSCTLSFEKSNGEFRMFEWNFRENYSLLYDDRGSNILMRYKYETYHDCRDAVRVSLHFSFKYPCNLKVTACGFRPLYLQDYERAFGKSFDFCNAKFVDFCNAEMVCLP